MIPRVRVVAECALRHRAAEAPSGRLEHAGPEAGDVVAEAVEQRADVAPVAERPARVRLRAGVCGQPVAVPENAVGADVVVVVVLAVVAALDGEDGIRDVVADRGRDAGADIGGQAAADVRALRRAAGREIAVGEADAAGEVPPGGRPAPRLDLQSRAVGPPDVVDVVLPGAFNS